MTRFGGIPPAGDTPDDAELLGLTPPREPRAADRLHAAFDTSGWHKSYHDLLNEALAEAPGAPLREALARLLDALEADAERPERLRAIPWTTADEYVQARAALDATPAPLLCDCRHPLQEHTNRGEQDAGLCLHEGCGCDEFVEPEDAPAPESSADDSVLQGYGPDVEWDAHGVRIEPAPAPLDVADERQIAYRNGFRDGSNRAAQRIGGKITALASPHWPDEEPATARAAAAEETSRQCTMGFCNLPEHDHDSIGVEGVIRRGRHGSL